MSSLLVNFPDFTITNLFHLLLILGGALLLNRWLRVFTKFILKSYASSPRTTPARDDQVRTLTERICGIASKIVWTAAILTAAQEIGINVIPLAIAGGLALVAVGFGAQQLVRDALAGLHVVLEDQFVIGDTIHTGDIAGRVEQFSFRRTVVRDSRGALVTIANGELRAVANLSRDWSQAFVDVSLSPAVPQETALHALDAVVTEMRGDSAWSAALVDGPRVVGLQLYDQAAATFRLQVRTVPARQDDVARELRRRIQCEFQRTGIATSHVQRVELVNPAVSQEMPQHASTV